MTKEPVNLDRAQAKHQAALLHLREKIVSGQYGPGDRLPPRRDLQQILGLSDGPIAKVFTRLIADGFVEARGRDGTFVVKNPPFLCNYGLVLPNPDVNTWSRYWQALHHEALELCKQQSRWTTNYFTDHHRLEKRNLQFLEHEVVNWKMTGLIFINLDQGLTDSPIIRQPGMPRVACQVVGHSYPDLPMVVTRNETIYTRGIKYLAERGRKRLAVIGMDHDTAGVKDRIMQQVALHGLRLDPDFLLIGQDNFPVVADSVASLLMRLPEEQRPDALLISDDHLVEPVSRGLIAAGVRSVSDLDIVAHANFPFPVRTGLPITYLGFDCRQIMQLCMASIDRQRMGEAVPANTEVNACFEHELSTSG